MIEVSEFGISEVTVGVDPLDLPIQVRHDTGTKLYGWYCYICIEGNNPIYATRLLPETILRKHLKSKDHRTLAASPSRHR